MGSSVGASTADAILAIAGSNAGELPPPDASTSRLDSYDSQCRLVQDGSGVKETSERNIGAITKLYG